MRRRISRLWLSGFSLGLALPACTTTYTEADLATAELQADKEARSEEHRDARIEQEDGGANADQIRQDEREVDQDSDL